MRTGILGGTFNPPHLGHLHAAELAHDALRLDRVLFIPTNLPPHKALPENTASPEARCEMVRRLTADRPWAQLDTLEIDRGGASYTVDTLRALHGRGETDLYLIIGTDMLLSFDRSWRAPDEIARLATLAVCARENEDWDALREKAAEEVETRGLSVRQTETLVASLLRQAEQPEKEEKKPPVVDYVREAEKALSDALGRGVKFQGGQKKGRIALEFYSADDREALMEALKHMDKPWKKK